MRNIENLSEFCTSVVGCLLSKSDKHCSTGVTIWGTRTAPTEVSHPPYIDAICFGAENKCLWAFCSGSI